MREIKFRGKAKTTIEELNNIGIEHENGWVFGNLISNGNNPMIVGEIADWGDDYIAHEWFVAVDPESVGQFTGEHDKNGVEIYERDLFQWDDDVVGVIKYQDGSFYLETNIELPGDSAHAPGFYSPWLRVIKHELETELEIIGNIHDNPELLGDQS